MERFVKKNRLFPLLFLLSFSYIVKGQGLTTVVTGAVSGAEMSLSTLSVVNASCIGVPDGQIAISASGGSPGYSYSWYDNAGINAATRTGLVSGSYTVETTDAVGCKKTLNINVGFDNISSTPPTAATSTQINLCTGSTATLTLVGGGGGTNADIKWYEGSCGGTLVGVGNNITVSPTVTTTYYGRYEDICSVTTCESVTINVMIPSPPTIAFDAPTTNNTTLTTCLGNLVKIHAVNPNISEYLWYKNGSLFYYSVAPNDSLNISTNLVGTDVYQLAAVYSYAPQCISALSAPLTLIKTTPVAAITPGASVSTCANVPITLSAATGTNYSYVWRRGSTIVQVGGSNYTPTLSGNHNVTVTDQNTGCTRISAWTNVTINALPPANAGANRSVCLGIGSQIGATSVAGNTYTWSPTTGLSNPYISNPIASPTTTTTYNLTVRNNNTGCMNTATMVYTSLPLPPTPTISSTTPATVCQGATVNITPTSVGAASINWYRNGQLVYNKATTFIQNVIQPTPTPDNYTIRTVGANGCLSNTSNTVSAWVREAAIPIITSSPAAIGNTITVCVLGGTSGNATLTANSTTASPTYTWRLNGVNISGANSNTYLANVSTTNNNKVFSVQATYPNGCVKTSSNRTVRLVTTGCTPTRVAQDKGNEATEINLETDYLTVYPNPTNSWLNINVSSSTAQEGELLLYNALGQIVVQKKVTLTNGKAFERIDLTDIAAGMYSLIFQSEHGELLKKVVKE